MDRVRVLASHVPQREAAAEECAGQRVSVPFGPDAVKAVMAKFKAWERYMRAVPKRLDAIAASSAGSAPTFSPDGHDVVVVGFGAAGAAAALEAAEGGARVLLVDRYGGGGSTRRSGGIIYAGGGTSAQRRAGVQDTAENMYSYLRTEAPSCVDDRTVRDFCDRSRSNVEWLERLGVRFADESGSTVVLHGKSSYPPSRVCLYNSGNEASHPWRATTQPAMRGHRPFGQGLTGHVLFTCMEEAVLKNPRITVVRHCVCTRLVTDGSGRVAGASVRQLPARADAEQLHSTLHGIGSGSTQLDPTSKVAAACIRLSEMCFDRIGLPPVDVPAPKGVVIACGGFFFNQAMVREHAPKYLGLMPLGNIGDDGSGIRLGAGVGGAVGQMGRASAWKFLSPPYDFIRGVLVSKAGRRVRNEDVYGATLADKLVQEHGGEGWLLFDSAVFESCESEASDPASDLDSNQRVQALMSLHRGCKKADTWDALCKKCNAPEGSFTATMERYNAQAAKGVDEDFGKVRQYLVPLERGPFYALNMNMKGNKYWPTPCMTLGGLVVSGSTGLVLRESGAEVGGLYAAGRSAVGVASNYYLSGLSIADAIFSGRRAGGHAAAQ
eukprot:TRINITY_DN40108_c0_g1_i1.p1 TRINITY_DN40108_c0_g1~~TRINITY_DN40108_c0_g1_i1.p1  ORF type:complete len:608 (+),score=197.28 TRINITY_DN40108_c0_g1_i1:70-1893(+)